MKRHSARICLWLEDHGWALAKALAAAAILAGVALALAGCAVHPHAPPAPPATAACAWNGCILCCNDDGKPCPPCRIEGKE